MRVNPLISQNLLLCAGLLGLFALQPASARAEGSKQLMQDTASRAALCTNDGSFAAYTSAAAPYTRLNIHIANPATEKVYLGFSAGYSTGASNILGEGSVSTSTYYFRIKDPAGNIVFGPQALDASNAIPAGLVGYNQIQAGPAAMGNAGGYTGFSFTPAANAPAGDYYIEFNKNPVSASTSQVSLDYWDITVSDAVTNTEKTGRIWSKRWGFYSKDYIDGLGNPIGYSGRYDGQLYSYTDSGMVVKIQFNGSGFRGGSFLLGMNQSGPGTSGNYLADRKSVFNASKIAVGYKVFINDPDVLIYPSGASNTPTFEFKNPVVACGATHIDLNYTSNRDGIVQFVLDFNNNGIYDPNTRDVQLARVSPAGDQTITWDLKDGLGNPVSRADLPIIRVLAQHQLGVHHISLHDIEYMNNGFSVTQVRPVFNNGIEDKFYWDDSLIKTSTGVQDPYTAGPQPPYINPTGQSVRKWNNFTDNSTAGFGNKNSINTWWSINEVDISNRAFYVLPCGTLSVSGAVWEDANGDGIQQPQEPYTAVAKAGDTLYAVLIQTSNTPSGQPVVFHAARVMPGTGRYNITNVTAGNNYEVRIVSLPEAPLNGRPAADLLPALAHNYTGVSTNNDGAILSRQSTDNLVVALSSLTVSAASVNFGIEQRPTAQSLTTAITTPAIGQFLTLDGAGTNPPLFEGSDPEDQPQSGSLLGKNVAIASLPAKGALYYNHTLITAGADGINPPAANNLFVIPGSFDPAKMQVKCTGKGSTSLAFDYTYIDAAGQAAAPASYQLHWTQPLPVQVAGFRVTSQSRCKITLGWNLLTEMSGTTCELERSADALKWEKRHSFTIKAIGVAAERYTDTAPLEGKNFYRLRFREASGAEVLSPIAQAVATCQEPAAIVFYPNPVQTQLAIKGLEAGYTLKLFNAQGLLLQQQQGHVGEMRIDLSLYLPGTYFVIITDATGTALHEEKLLKH